MPVSVDEVSVFESGVILVRALLLERTGTVAALKYR